jgi:hypothetical protein
MPPDRRWSSPRTPLGSGRDVRPSAGHGQLRAPALASSWPSDVPSSSGILRGELDCLVFASPLVSGRRFTRAAESVGRAPSGSREWEGVLVRGDVPLYEAIAQRCPPALRDRLGKIAAKWFARFRPQVDGTALLESEATKSVPFRVVLPRAALNCQCGGRRRLHRRRVERQREPALFNRFHHAARFVGRSARSHRSRAARTCHHQPTA